MKVWGTMGIVFGVCIIFLSFFTFALQFFPDYVFDNDGKCYDKFNNEIIGQRCDTSISKDDKIALFIFSNLFGSLSIIGGFLIIRTEMGKN